ncbi:C40 family peptidase [Actinoplanes sp. NPDC051861]|uniref:C40 family peptidase n=1 Tax=Actinoplanes sp. NPDC051861 TaxID=3155170 RepID=UPI00343E56C5
MTAGALALAVIAPALDPVEHAAEAVITPPQALPTTPELPDLSPGDEIQGRQLRNRDWQIPLRADLDERAAAVQRASRSMPRRPAARAAARQRPVVAPAARQAVKLNNRPAAQRFITRDGFTNRESASEAARGTAREVARGTAREARGTARDATREAARDVTREAARDATREAARDATRGRADAVTRGASGGTARGAARGAADGVVRGSAHAAAGDTRAHRRVAVQQKRTTVSKRSGMSVRKTTRSTSARRLKTNPGRRMDAVIAFARSQVGKRYVRGGEGAGGFDCSGFTKRAYARAGLRLPHSSGAQARRARAISRSQARPGDLVVGRGHVGIYMGNDMMIDAGNQRTGVVYRKLYRGLKVARL